MSTDKELVERLQVERRELQQRIKDIDSEILEERFRDIETRSRGDRVLVDRLLFGRKKLWPAEIDYVHRDYSEGTYGLPPNETHYESHRVSYHVRYVKPDGTLDNESHSYWASEVHDAPKEAEA